MAEILITLEGHDQKINLAAAVVFCTALRQYTAEPLLSSAKDFIAFHLLIDRLKDQVEVSIVLKKILFNLTQGHF